MESEIQLKESGTLLTIGIQNPSSTEKDWNPIPGICNLTAWNSESKNVLDSTLPQSSTECYKVR